MCGNRLLRRCVRSWRNAAAVRQRQGGRQRQSTTKTTRYVRKCPSNAAGPCIHRKDCRDRPELVGRLARCAAPRELTASPSSPDTQHKDSRIIRCRYHHLPRRYFICWQTSRLRLNVVARTIPYTIEIRGIFLPCYLPRSPCKHTKSTYYRESEERGAKCGTDR